jgi:hypothetical protein
MAVKTPPLKYAFVDYEQREGDQHKATKGALTITAEKFTLEFSVDLRHKFKLSGSMQSFRMAPEPAGKKRTRLTITAVGQFSDPPIRIIVKEDTLTFVGALTAKIEEMARTVNPAAFAGELERWWLKPDAFRGLGLGRSYLIQGTAYLWRLRRSPKVAWGERAVVQREGRRVRGVQEALRDPVVRDR